MNEITMEQAVPKLKSLGFSFGISDHPNYGTIAPEAYNTGRNHFSPASRDIFISRVPTGFYITSDIYGDFRAYRGRTTYRTKVGNNFGGGKTLAEGLSVFVQNFTNKTYNVTKI